MKNNLKVSNICMHGRLPFKRKLTHEEANKLIQSGQWICNNEENSPLLQRRFNVREKAEYSVHNKLKQPHVSLTHTGAIIIVGLKTIKEGYHVYDLVVKEIKKISRSLLK